MCIQLKEEYGPKASWLSVIFILQLIKFLTVSFSDHPMF